MRISRIPRLGLVFAISMASSLIYEVDSVVHRGLRKRESEASAFAEKTNGYGNIDIGGDRGESNSNHKRQSSAVDGDTQKELWALICETNKYRTQNNLGVLYVLLSLNEDAKAHSVYQNSIATMTHDDPNGNLGNRLSTVANIKWSSYAENVAYGQKSAKELIQAWKNSPVHNANLLNPKVNAVGVGKVGPYWSMSLAQIPAGQTYLKYLPYC